MLCVSLGFPQITLISAERFSTEFICGISCGVGKMLGSIKAQSRCNAARQKIMPEKETENA